MKTILSPLLILSLALIVVTTGMPSIAFGQAPTATLLAEVALMKVPPATTYSVVDTGSDYDEGDVLQAKWSISFDSGGAGSVLFEVYMSLNDSYYTHETYDTGVAIVSGQSVSYHTISTAAQDPYYTVGYDAAMAVENTDDPGVTLTYGNSLWWFDFDQP